MKNKLIGLILAAAMLVSMLAVPAGAADTFVLNAEFDFSDDGEYICISGTTPAKYGQAINVVIYDPDFENGLEDIREENGALSSDPASKKPLSDVGNIIRWAETRATADGSYSIRFALDGIENGKYMIIKASGSGNVPVSASLLRQYYTDDTITNVTLPAFESATADELEELLFDNQLLLGIELGDDYSENKDEIHKMFVSVREYDCKVDAATGRKFNSMQDIVNVLACVDALREIPETLTADYVRSFIERYSTLISYDFSSANEHYTLVKTAAYEITANILNESAPACMTDIATAIEQAVGLAMLNTKNATTVAPVIEKYATVLGLDKTDYAIYCDTYTAYKVNQAFVEMNFTHPSQVAQALNARIDILEEESSSGGSDSSGSSGGGGGGGSPSSSIKNILGVNDALITSDKEKDEAKGTYYSDITNAHWAYDAIQLLSSEDVVAGYPDGTFMPDTAVTREQLVKMIIIAFEMEAGASDTGFSDVSSDRWSASYIKAGYDKGIVAGYPDGTFMPENAVTRQDAAVMLARVCKAMGMSLEERKTLSDADAISAYAVQSVEELVAAGVISGFEDGSFRPMEKLTRAQAAQLIAGLLKK